MAKKTNSTKTTSSTRLSIAKTYKLYIGGKFPRTESGRYYSLYNSSNNLIANMCLSSRKDLRNAVTAARSAQGGWASRTAYNRGQILYRIAEMLEGRKAQFIAELIDLGTSSKAAEKEVITAIDRIVYYAGWCDKYSAIFSAVNPVASNHFNFSILEPMGVVGAFAPKKQGLLGLVTAILPIIAGGNTVIILASEKEATCAISFAEVLATSDVPNGVVNILTGKTSELIEHYASHKDINAIVYYGTATKDKEIIQASSTSNLKRSFFLEDSKLESDLHESPYRILDLQETKTVWHTIDQNLTGGGGAY